MSEQCPECDSEWKRRLAPGSHADSRGFRYWCGSIYYPDKDGLTTRGKACERIQDLEAEVERLRGIIKEDRATFRRFRNCAKSKTVREDSMKRLADGKVAFDKARCDHDWRTEPRITEPSRTTAHPGGASPPEHEQIQSCIKCGATRGGNHG